MIAALHFAALGALVPTQDPAAADQVERFDLSRSNNDWEPSLDVGPDGLVVVVAIRKSPPPESGKGEPPGGATLQPVVWVSRDGGGSFAAPIVPAGALHTQGDPRIRVDGAGKVYATWIAFDWDASGQGPVLDRGGLVLARSEDRGATFALENLQPLLGVGDKPELAVSRDGKDIAVAYTGRGGTLELLASHDAGATFAKHVVHAEPALYWPTSLSFGAEGALVLTHPRPLGTPGAATTAFELELLVSLDGGATFEGQVLSASDLPPPRIDPATGQPDSRSVHGPGGPRQLPYPVAACDGKGRIHLACSAGSAGEPYALRVQHSEDGGATWSEPRTLSGSPRPLTEDTADVFYPMVAASGDGLVYVAWFDDRSGPINLWARRSTDAGATWSDEVRLSRPDRGGFERIYGEYGGLAIDAEGTLHAAWAEGNGHISEDHAQGGVRYARWRFARD